jgi:antitoxin component of RelBE/YafQ-DinJ toxin-antitoxin module
MGLKPADVVNMVSAQIEQRRALPFDVADRGGMRAAVHAHAAGGAG